MARGLARTIVFAATALSAIWGLALPACGSFGEDASSSPPGAPDAAAVEAAAASDAPFVPSAEGGEAGHDDAGCTVLVDDAFADIAATRARWRLLGSAQAMAGEVELVPDLTSQAGAIWMNVPTAPTGTLHARFTSKITPADGYDGMTFTWAANQDENLGGGGGNWGVCSSGADGLSFVLAANDRGLKLIDPANDCGAQPTAFLTNVFGTNAVDLVAKANGVAVTISDKPFMLTAPRSVHVHSIGFTAATGALHARHAIANVHVEVCPP